MNNATWARWQEELAMRNGIAQSEFGNYSIVAWDSFFALWRDYVLNGLTGGREHPPQRPVI